MRTYEYGNLDAQTVLIQPVDDHELPLMEKEWQEIRNLTDKDVLLIAVKVNSWNDDLSPWEAPAVFGKDGFWGRAEKMLEIIRQLCQENSNSYYLGGYSLAGLVCTLGWLSGAICRDCSSLAINVFSGIYRLHGAE